MKGIYLDNAATTRIKPESVREAMFNFYDKIGCSPGRGGYECSLDASRIVLNARVALCKLFNVEKPENIVLTHNITYALNMLLKGLLKEGDHVVTTSMEHNAVIRPLNDLIQTRNISVDYVKANKKGEIDVSDLEKAINDNTRLLLTTHASNVTGTILPIKEIAKVAQKHKLLYVVDSAQTAGSYPIDMEALNIDVLAFTGHKGLFGPTGTGGFILKEGVEKQINSLIQGGTGSISNKDYQPDFMPDKFESGTTNTIGIAGLGAGVEFILEKGVSTIHEKKQALTQFFIEELLKIDGVEVKGPQDATKQTATVSIDIPGEDLGNLSFELDNQFGVMTRSGLHCAPYAHETIGTFPNGTLRFSVGYFNTKEEIKVALEALKKLIK